MLAEEDAFGRVVSGFLSWPVLFLMGIVAGIALGIASGLPPVTGGSMAREVQNPSLELIDGTDQSALASLALSPEEGPAVNPSSFELQSVNVSLLPLINPPLPVALPAESRDSQGTRDDGRPRIAVVIDDVGLSDIAFEKINALPAPVTVSFLPYALDAQDMLDDLAPGHEPMLHLPMEPVSRPEVAGPDMLHTEHSPGELRRLLAKNLRKLSGYVGVNNHTGSRFTADAARMRVVLEELDRRGLYFLDSVTTKDRVAADLARQTRWRVIERDVFLDSEWPEISSKTVAARLADAEQIARTHGVAVVIGHPYDETLDELDAWLADAEARGINLVTVSDLMPARIKPKVLAGLR